MLDGFAGTGALGLDAAHVTFVERRHALTAPTTNVRACGAEDACVIIRDDFERWRADETFDLVMLDPPYEV